MDFVKQWTFGVCITVIVSVVLTFVSPNGNLGRFYKIIVSVMIFVSFLTPFKNFNFYDFEKTFDTISDYTNSKNDELLEETVKQQVKTCLKNNGYDGCDVNCSIVLDENNLATIDNIEVAACDEYDFDKIKRVIYQELKLNVRVIHIGQ